LPGSIPEVGPEAASGECIPLVSIVTPCFNGEKHVGRLIESVLAQTHENIEFILVNDGSTDGTDAVVASYRERLNTELTRFVYVQQENAGLGGAINGGLPHVTGQYLCWPDADDYLEPNSVELRLKALVENPDYAVVTSDAYLRSAVDGHLIGLASGGTSENSNPSQFEKLLSADSIFVPGCHMARMDLFDGTHPGRTIYPARRGQNWQILLPLYYRYKRLYLDVPLYNYMVSPSSMSAGDTTVAKQIERVKEHREIKLKTLEAMDMDPAARARWNHEIQKIYLSAVVNIWIRAGDFTEARAAYRDLKAAGSIPTQSRLRFVLKLANLRFRSNG